LAQYWIKEFEKPIEELFLYGCNSISSAYGILIDYYRDWLVKEKYDRIYSKTTDFNEWVRLVDNNKTLMEGGDVPFNMADVADKASKIIKIRN